MVGDDVVQGNIDFAVVGIPRWIDIAECIVTSAGACVSGTGNLKCSTRFLSFPDRRSQD